MFSGYRGFPTGREFRFKPVSRHTPGAFRATNLVFDIEVTGNTFSDSGGRIAGGYFGPAHEEMAGVLRDEASNVNLLGGFGGTR